MVGILPRRYIGNFSEHSRFCSASHAPSICGIAGSCGYRCAQIWDDACRGFCRVTALLAIFVARPERCDGFDISESRTLYMRDIEAFSRRGQGVYGLGSVSAPYAWSCEAGLFRNRLGSRGNVRSNARSCGSQDLERCSRRTRGNLDRIDCSPTGMLQRWSSSATSEVPRTDRRRRAGST